MVGAVLVLSHGLSELRRQAFAWLLAVALASAGVAGVPVRAPGAPLAEGPATSMVEVLAEQGVLSEASSTRARERAPLPRPHPVGRLQRPPQPPPAGLPFQAAPREFDSHCGHGSPLIC